MKSTPPKTVLAQTIMSYLKMTQALNITKMFQTQLQEGENQSHVVNEAQPLHARKPVHRYNEEM